MSTPYTALLPLEIAAQPQRIGLLGGSFDPPHYGHLYLSQQAQRLFGLDQIFWLVTEQNPLKSHSPHHDLASRIAKAQAFIHKFSQGGKDYKEIRTISLEKALNSIYTSDIIAALTQNYPQHHFFWLMGADNLEQLPKWRNWQQIFRLATVVVFQRGQLPVVPSQYSAGRIFPHCTVIDTAKPMQTARLQSAEQAQIYNDDGLCYKPWYFVTMPIQEISSSEIRDKYTIS